jgi:hypothetical protein
LRHRLISSLSRLFRKPAQLAPRAEVDPLFPQRFGKLELLWHIQQPHVLHARQAQLLQDTGEELRLLEAAAGEARFEGTCSGICACRQCLLRGSKGRRNEWEQY